MVINTEILDLIIMIQVIHHINYCLLKKIYILKTYKVIEITYKTQKRKKSKEKKRN